jgi:hypothetical protein
MSGPGLYTVSAFCPKCLQEVQCEVMVTADDEGVHSISGPEQHDSVCLGSILARLEAQGGPR